jgi:hypothetical protein
VSASALASRARRSSGADQRRRHRHGTEDTGAAPMGARGRRRSQPRSRRAHRSGVRPIGVSTSDARLAGLGPGKRAQPAGQVVAIPGRPGPRARAARRTRRGSRRTSRPNGGSDTGRVEVNCAASWSGGSSCSLKPEAPKHALDLVQPFVHVALLRIGVGRDRPPVGRSTSTKSRPRTSRPTRPRCSPNRIARSTDRPATARTTSRMPPPWRPRRAAPARPPVARPTSAHRRSRTAT